MGYDNTSTMKLVMPMQKKSVVLRCSFCGDLIGIKSQKRDKTKTKVDYSLCSVCLANKEFYDSAKISTPTQKKLRLRIKKKEARKVKKVIIRTKKKFILGDNTRFRLKDNAMSSLKANIMSVPIYSNSEPSVNDF